MSLFGNTATGGRGASKNLVEFRAGKMTLKNTTVTADKRKGQLYIHQSDDGLIHLCWKDRKTQNVEDDLIIFPGDCEFKRIPECTTGRVYLLRFKNPSRKFFFWMQEPKTDKDEDICKKVNDSINNPPSQESETSGLSGSNFQDLFSNMNQQQLLQMMSQSGVGANLNDWLGGAGGGGVSTRSQRSQQQSSRTSTVSSSNRPRSTATSNPPAAPTTTSDKKVEKPKEPKPVTSDSATASKEPTSPGVQLAQLKDILSEMGVDREPVDLSEAITPDVMAPILTNSEVQERLKPFLPEDESLPSTTEELKQTVHSPQFKQAMRSFSAALSSGQLGPVMKQFGLSEAAQSAANTGDVEAFARAMQGNELKKEDQRDEKME